MLRSAKAASEPVCMRGGGESRQGRGGMAVVGSGSEKRDSGNSPSWYSVIQRSPTAGRPGGNCSPVGESNT